MDNIHLNILLLLPPVLLCAAIYIYEKFVKTPAQNQLGRSSLADYAQQKKSSDPQKLQLFILAMSRLGSTKSSEVMHANAKPLLEEFDNPYVAALEAYGAQMKLVSQNPSSVVVK